MKTGKDIPVFPSREPVRVQADLSDTVGARLQALRKKFGLSQRELARRADVTNSTLSMIEQGKVSPSVGSLEKILLAFPVSLQEFFSGSIELATPVVRSANFIAIEHESVQIRSMPLYSGRSKQSVRMNEQKFPPGARIHSDWLTFKGFIAGMVMQGSIELYLEGVQYHLDVGDGFNFSSLREYNLMNSGDGVCVIVCVEFGA